MSTGTKRNGVDVLYRGQVPGYYAELPSVTGAFYSGGRLFYTLAGRTQLFWRWFGPDSGIVGAAEFSTTGLDLSHVAGMFVSGSSIYWANAVDGTMHRANLVGTTVDPTSDTVVGGPIVDGHDWRAHGLFAYGTATFPSRA